MPDALIDEAVLAQLLETVGGDRTFLAELVEAYLADSPGLVEEMRTSLARGDRTALRRAAHTLKSTSASLGATAFADACRGIEHAAEAGESDALAAAIEAAATDYEGVAAALRARIGSAA